MEAGVLVVSGNAKTAEALRDGLAPLRMAPFSLAATGGEARSRHQQHPPEIAVINAPLADGLGDELACTLAGQGVGVVLLVAGEAAGEVASRVEKAGVLVLPKPLSPTALLRSVQHLRATGRLLAALRAENETLRRRLEEQRVVGRAKCALVQYRGYTEQEAHHFIEREAMDARITKKQVAEELLRTFEG